MILSKTSFWARLYDFFYKSDLPNNLCPYFWKLLAAIIFVIPVTAFCLPSYIGARVFRDDELEGERLGARISVSFAIYIILILLFMLIMGIVWIFTPLSGIIRSFAVSGDFLWILIILIVLCEIVKRIRKKVSHREKKPSLISSFIQAKKDKLCPRIDWKD